MSKKMKWSIISISTATALTFGGLVVNNQKIVSNTNSTTENDSIQDNYSSSNKDEWQTDDYSEGNDESDYEQDSEDDYYSDEGGYNQDSSDQGSSWGQDQFQQAPSSGFEQGHGSSGASR